MYAECGAMLGKIVKQAVKHDLIGLENLNGVPGTLGWRVGNECWSLGWRNFRKLS
jgi:UDP-N-acetylenolpyruvoylglucosamine reductase